MRNLIELKIRLYPDFFKNHFNPCRDSKVMSKSAIELKLC